MSLSAVCCSGPVCTFLDHPYFASAIAASTQLPDALQVLTSSPLLLESFEEDWELDDVNDEIVRWGTIRWRERSQGRQVLDIVDSMA